MSSQEQWGRYQPAVLWSAVGFDNNAQPTYSAPVQIYVRWDDVKKQRQRPDGTTVEINAELLVDQDIKIGSKMWRGSLDDWYAEGSSGYMTQLMEVVNFDRQQDMKHRFATRTVSLTRWKSS